jgi:hypothetical protein
MRKNAKTITSPNGELFKRGQKVYSYGDENTFGFIDCWDLENGTWKLKHGNREQDSFMWMPEGELTSEINPKS